MTRPPQQRGRYGRNHVDEKLTGCGFPVDFALLVHTLSPTLADTAMFHTHLVIRTSNCGPDNVRAMRQLLPTTAEHVDPLTRYPTDARRAPSDRPWVMANMVASADGAIAIDGVSGGLGGDGDRLVFRAVRASCDWVVVAAGTARAERYGLPRPDAGAAAARLDTGRDRAARLAVVTASVDLPIDLPMFGDRRDGEHRPLIVTGNAPPRARVDEIGDRAEWVHVEAIRPTPELVLAELRSRGADVVLSEGGPSFNGQLADAGLIDELCLTISPQLVGGTSPRIVNGATRAIPAELELDRLLEHDGALFARYVRR